MVADSLCLYRRKNKRFTNSFAIQEKGAGHGFISSRMTSPKAVLTNGVADPEAVICTSAKTDWFITAHNSVAFREFHCRNIRRSTYAKNSTRKNPARNFA